MVSQHGFHSGCKDVNRHHAPLSCRKAYRLGKFLGNVNTLRKTPLITPYGLLEWVRSAAVPGSRRSTPAQQHSTCGAT